MSGVDSEVRTEGGLGGGRRWRNLMIDARQSSSTASIQAFVAMLA